METSNNAFLSNFIEANLDKIATLFTLSDRVMHNVNWDYMYTTNTDDEKKRLLSVIHKLFSSSEIDEKSLTKKIVYDLMPSDKILNGYCVYKEMFEWKSQDKYKTCSFLDKYNDRVKSALIKQIELDSEDDYYGRNYEKIYDGLETLDDCINILDFLNNPPEILKHKCKYNHSGSQYITL